ncbi:putative dual specificity protein phosphatase [Gregarina niphandrodes]|uniref:Dual specificity protein phosphatase n=1 Tax=Gregarina niphandrodes TaxID=110365 RepID=A0A023B5S0_GRENI|nr:putative dual specificity protein phosphatase [Gregarina niphandrodes]EZG61132.1 putative dual specificity protein phosphatase [Gregarina niphandrodes]|eukprot:XP_011130785.1 putative dual specificity protein phosphatase [Gregarina niphandrodes]
MRTLQTIPRIKGIPALNIGAIGQSRPEETSGSSKRSPSYSLSSGPESVSRLVEMNRHRLSVVWNGKLFIGGEYVARDLPLLKQSGITHILNVAGEECNNYFPNEFEYCMVVIQDSRLLSVSLESVLFDGICFINTAIMNGGKVLVHCREGVSRSATYVIAFLMWKEGWDFRQSLERVKECRPSCAPNTGFTVSLIKLQKILCNTRPPSVSRDEPMRLYRAGVHHPKAPFTVVVELGSRADNNKSEWTVTPILLDSRFVYILRPKTRRFYVWEGSEVTMGVRSALLSATTRFLNNVRQFECAPGERLEVMYVQQGEEPNELLDMLKGPTTTTLEALSPEASMLQSGAIFTWDSWLNHLRPTSKYAFLPAKVLSPPTYT